MRTIGVLCRVPWGWAAAAALIVCLAGIPAAQARFRIEQRDSHSEDGTGSGAGAVFCDGNRCPGRTCDPVNSRCVGEVTLQPCLGRPLVGLTTEERERFEAGKDAFRTNLVEATGLGPVFNQTSCGSCHNLPLGGSGSISVTRFGTLDFGDFSFDPLSGSGGSLLNAQAIRTECAETIPVPPANISSQRLTNSTLGFGLVDAIPDADIELNANNPPGPVSGRALLVPVLEDPPNVRVGRFGWKSQLATVLSFSADAALQEMGLTSRLFPVDNAPNNDLALLAECDSVPDPEDVPDASGLAFIDRVTDFQLFLAPPPQTPRSGMSGEVLFDDIGCADCHVTTFGTPDDPTLEEARRNTVFHPYSDFLVHDMGFSADFIEQGDAGVFEIRTSPLWGLRIRDPLWHDGRVAGGTFASRITGTGGIIDQHDGFGSEAGPSAQAFRNLSETEQDEVIAFLESLGRCEFDGNGDNIVNDLDMPSFVACFNQIGVFFSPDHECAVHDVDQDGFVEADDFALFEVALGLVVTDDEDEDEDDDGDPGDGQDDESTDATSVGDVHVSFTSGGAGSDNVSTSTGADEPRRPRDSRGKARTGSRGNSRHRGL